MGVDRFTGHPHVLVTIMAANVGLDPVHDIEWVEGGDILAAVEDVVESEPLGEVSLKSVGSWRREN